MVLSSETEQHSYELNLKQTLSVICSYVDGAFVAAEVAEMRESLETPDFDLLIAGAGDQEFAIE